MDNDYDEGTVEGRKNLVKMFREMIVETESGGRYAMYDEDNQRDVAGYLTEIKRLESV